MATIDTYTFDNPDDEARFKELSIELRCLVCQNQNLADSNAPIAKDMREKIHEHISNEDPIVSGQMVRAAMKRLTEYNPTRKTENTNVNENRYLFGSIADLSNDDRAKLLREAADIIDVTPAD